MRYHLTLKSYTHMKQIPEDIKNIDYYLQMAMGLL